MRLVRSIGSENGGSVIEQSRCNESINITQPGTLLGHDHRQREGLIRFAEDPSIAELTCLLSDCANWAGEMFHAGMKVSIPAGGRNVSKATRIVCVFDAFDS